MKAIGISCLFVSGANVHFPPIADFMALLHAEVGMPRKFLTRRFWEPIARSLFLIATGAYLLSWYLKAVGLETAELRTISHSIDLIWWIFLMAWAATMPRRKPEVDEPSPAASGTAVVLVTGLCAAGFLARDASWPRGYVVPAVITVITLAIAAVVYRFASKNASGIGEARFDTSGPAT